MRQPSSAAGAVRARPLDLATWNRELNRTHAMAALRARAGPIVRAIESRRRRLVARRVLRGPHARVIDVGCEDGWMSAAWAAQVESLVLVDVDPATLQEARRRLPPGVRVAVADATDAHALEQVPEAGRADVVVLSALLEHVPAPGAVVRTALRLLAPGGRLVIFVPADGPILLAKSLLRHARLGGLVRGLDLEPAPGHLHRFDRPTLRRTLAPRGRIAELSFDPAVLGYVAVLRAPGGPQRET